MNNLAVFFNILAPIDSLSIGSEGTRVYFSWIICGILDIGGMVLLTVGIWRISRPTGKALFPFVLFLAVGLISVLTSPYRATSAVRGIEQFTGMCAMLLMVVCYDNMVRKNPALLLRLVRTSCNTLGVVGFVALFQFIVNNALNEHFIDFRLLAILLGNSDAPMDYGMMGPFWRSNSFLFEGDNLSLYSTVMLGMVWIRLGVLGPAAKLALKNIVPGWTAWCMAAGIATAMSATGYADFLLALVATVVVARRTAPRQVKVRKPRTRFQVIKRWSALVVVLVIPLAVGDALVEKYANLGSLGGVIAGTETDREHGANGDIMGLAANLVVAFQNLQERPLEGVGFGAHPASYDAHQPDFLKIFPAVIGQNKDDASGLLLRILSESGLLGMFFFASGWFMVIRRGWNSARFYGKDVASGGHETPLHLIAIGLTASSFAMVLFYLVKGVAYFDSNLWLCMALTTCVSRTQSVRASIKDSSHGGLGAIPDSSAIRSN